MNKRLANFKSGSLILTVLITISLTLSFPLQPLTIAFSAQKNVTATTLLTTAAIPDQNKNGVSDSLDIMLGARLDALNMPAYDDSYWAGGYPPDNIGVCADVVWRALKNAGYMLKDMIDADIAKNPKAYGIIKPDPNIDFRRVRNLRVFFDRHLQQETLNLYDISAWQPGDIVIMYPDFHHIGIVSDQRDFLGIPYLIHNTGQKDREEDILMYAYYHATITRHYRWIYTP